MSSTREWHRKRRPASTASLVIPALGGRPLGWFTAAWVFALESARMTSKGADQPRPDRGAGLRVRAEGGAGAVGDRADGRGQARHMTDAFRLAILEHAALARRRAEQCMAASARLCASARQEIAASRRRSRRRIAGGSATDPVTEVIRGALRAGALPQIDRRAWAGKAYGNHSCVCCSLHIPAGDAEYEPQGAPGRYAHIACFTAWHVESARLGQADGA